MLEEEYTFLFGEVLIGTSSECPIRITGSGLESIHARILHLGEYFWIENMTEKGTVHINGDSVPPYRLVALCTGMTVFVGDTALEWSEMQQHGL